MGSNWRVQTASYDVLSNLIEGAENGSRAACLSICCALCITAPRTRYIRARAKVVVPAHAGCAEVHLVRTALDDRLILSALITKRLSGALHVRLSTTCSPSREISGLNVEPSRNQHHAGRNNRHTEAQQGSVRVCSQCCWKRTEPKENNARADCDQPSPNFRRHANSS
jgi:hypothetical protein